MNIEPWERNYRSSRSQIFFKIGALKNFANFTGKHLCWSLFLIKLRILKLTNLLRRNSNTGAVRKKLQNFVNFTGKYLCWRFLSITLQAWRLATLLRTDSNTGVFLLNLRNFWEHLFYRTPTVATFETKHMLQLPFYYIIE